MHALPQLGFTSTKTFQRSASLSLEECRRYLAHFGGSLVGSNIGMFVLLLICGGSERKTLGMGWGLRACARERPLTCPTDKGEADNIKSNSVRDMRDDSFSHPID